MDFSQKSSALAEETTAAAAGIARRVRARCLQKQWDLNELSRRAGLSPGTLHQLLHGRTRRPHLKTIARLADALDVSVAELCADEAGAHEKGESDRQAAEFDRRTNPRIAEVAGESPHLFAGWSTGDWDGLYSQFGAGGALTRDGVVRAAERVNRRRETLRRLRVVLETHLEDVATEMVGALYRMVRPASNLEGAYELDALIRQATVKDHVSHEHRPS